MSITSVVQTRSVHYELLLNKGLTMKPSLARIVFFVRDAASLAEWYRDVFGLTTTYGAIVKSCVPSSELSGSFLHDPVDEGPSFDDVNYQFMGT